VLHSCYSNFVFKDKQYNVCRDECALHIAREERIRKHLTNCNQYKFLVLMFFSFPIYLNMPSFFLIVFTMPNTQKLHLHVNPTFHGESHRTCGCDRFKCKRHEEDSALKHSFWYHHALGMNNFLSLFHTSGPHKHKYLT
jgi:hypothetical protein